MTLAAIQHLLNRRRILAVSWRLFAAWRRHEQTFQSRPIPKEILIGLAGFFLSIDRKDECLAIIIAYATFLRTAKFLSMCLPDFYIDTGKLFIHFPLNENLSSQRRIG